MAMQPVHRSQSVFTPPVFRLVGQAYGTVLTIVLGALLAATGTAHGAQVYRWVDENGQVHYGERPPVESGAERLKVPDRLPEAERAAAEERERQTRERADAAARRRREDAEVRAAASARARAGQEARSARCADARERLDVFEQQLPVYRDA